MKSTTTLFCRSVLMMLLGVSLGSTSLLAQMRVGQPATSPDPSAAFEVSGGPYSSGSQYRGIAPPKVALSQTSSPTPVTNPATGLLVYNTVKAGDVTPGYYYWEGERWVRFSTTSTGAARVAAAGGGQPIKAYLLSEVQNQVINDDSFILVEPGREGLFRYDATDTTPDNSGTVLVAAANKHYKRSFSGPVDVRWFGAKGDATTDDRIAIQKALDSNHPDITLPAGYTFVVSLNPAFNTPEGGTGIALNLSSNKILRVLGTIKLKSGTTGNSSVMISNSAPIINVHVMGDGMGVVDGNRNQVTGTTINVCLFKATDSSIEGITALNSSFFGLSFRGRTPGFGRNIIRNCKVNNMAYIGIQAEKPDLGIRIEGNTVTNCGDNGIDIEGNNTAGEGYGRDIYILTNVIRKCALGIFLESVGNALISENIIDSVGSNCIYINRINSGSFANRILNNKFKNCPSGYGVNFNSYVGESDVSNNYFENLHSSIYFNGGATKVTVGTNSHKAIEKYLIQVAPITNSTVKCYVDKQILSDAPNPTTGYPFVVSPITNPINRSDRAYLTTVADGYSLELGATLPTTFSKRTTTASINSNWNAYAIFYNNQTLLYVPNNAPSITDYVNINGTVYYISGMSASGEYIIQNINKVSGNYAAAINSNYTISIYYSAWMVD